ncbi:transposase [Catenulispora sp. GP43]|uniref:transposase n=1 Tax=Catenulispora sp. GP43 TaxID=3156263 RepID=UPI003518CF48
MCEETRQHGSGGGRRKRTRTTGTSPAAYLTLNTHLTAGMKQYIAAHDWLTVYQLPAYAPQLNPVEGIWSLIRRNLANTAFTDPEHLIAAVRRELPAVQYRSWLVDGVLVGTGLAVTAS